jgi:hypothetical protein
MVTLPDTFELIEGDTLPQITGTLTEDDGTTPVDITGYDIKLHVGYDTPLVKTAVIPVGTNGQFAFPWVAGDLTPGLWLAEIQIASPSGVLTLQKNTQGKRFKIKINPQGA